MKRRYNVLALGLLLAGCGSTETDTGPAPFPVYSDDQNQFMDDNTARAGVMTTPSGLQYEVLRAAEGAKPTAQSNVTVHYAGTLTDGTEFDSSYAREQPSTFELAATIPGWIEGLQLMSVGSQYRFVIPSELAYGERGAGSVIGPDEVLIFIVELLEINS